MSAPPGTSWVYNNSACQVLSAVIRNATGRQPHEIARDRLRNRIGMHGASWLTDAYAALGLGNQAIYVVPSLKVVAVRLGLPSANWSDDTFLGMICAAAE